MHVGDDGRNGASLVLGRIGAPRRGWQVFDKVAIDAVVGVKRDQQGVGEDKGGSRFLGHRIPRNEENDKQPGRNLK
jgi:hypothetical protein